MEWIVEHDSLPLIDKFVDLGEVAHFFSVMEQCCRIESSANPEKNSRRISMSVQIEEVFNFLKLSDRLTTAGQPTEAQFPAIAQAGYQVVINLAMPDSTNAIPHEAAIVKSLGMEYVHIPVIWTEPTLDDLDRFFNILNTNAEKPVFVHCAMNMRVSAFIYLYRRIHDQMSHEAAAQDLHQIWVPNDDWQKFIQHAIEHYQVQNLNE
jgi:uncharacterized protein (TIGR01244 family)